MKNLVIFFGLAIVVLMVSCTPKTETTTVTTTNKTVITEPGADGFRLKKMVVVNGNTVWGFSQKVYGTGTRWREIVAQNPFLDNSERTYFDRERNEWIVIIKPNEELKIGNENITPSYVVEQTTTNTTSPATNASVLEMPSWGWALIIVGIIVLLFYLFLKNNSTSTTDTHVKIPQNGSFDTATKTALMHREYNYRNRVLGIAEKSADRNLLERIFVEENPDEFVMSAKFFKGKDSKKGKGK